MSRLIEIDDPASCPVPLQIRAGDVLMFKASGALLRSGEDAVSVLGSFTTALVTGSGVMVDAHGPPHTVLLLNHWGSVDAPDMTPFNGDPQQLAKLVANPQRIRVLAPGEPFTLQRLKTTRSSKGPNATRK